MLTPQQEAFQKKVDDKFPPALPAEVNSVATFIPSRQPAFKVHSKVGLAHNALGGKGFYESRAKYELRDGEWQRVWYYVPPINCQRCNRKYDDVVSEDNRQSQSGPRRWRVERYHHDPTYKGLKYLETPVCRICKEEIKQEATRAEQEAAARSVHAQFFTN